MKHQQAESRFFGLAAETRQQIYGYLYPHGFHFVLVNGVPRLTPCEGPDDDSDRRPNDSEAGYLCPLWTQRVNSSWGCHWRCEEAYLNRRRANCLVGNTYAHDIPELRACKKLYVPFHNHPTRSLNSQLDGTLSHQKYPCEPSSSKGRITPLPYENIRHLDITLRISGLFFYMVVKAAMQSPSPGLMWPLKDSMRPKFGPQFEQFVQWNRIWNAAPCMPALKSLSLWLDHGEPFSWAWFDERQVLSRLTEVMPALERKGVHVAVCLPSVVPTRNDYVRFRTFGQGKDRPRFQLNRRRRLVWFDVDCPKGLLWVEDSVSGPAPCDTPDLLEEAHDDDDIWIVLATTALNGDMHLIDAAER
ncbi:hypothetical protein CSOJ01_04794 [Colletotrichum sojae]|uniref:Uncharacterized protein n=1 Tax=Colletotrichum sojae TaxID=2175907 RepID=A0A8H6MYM8_9PEZI|nr:hypothetical protein CSOJ01_04794 [Colletotrichum sojae]